MLLMEHKPKGASLVPPLLIGCLTLLQSYVSYCGPQCGWGSLYDAALAVR